MQKRRWQLKHAIQCSTIDFMTKRTERIVVLLTSAELGEVDKISESLAIRTNRSEVIRELLRRGLDVVATDGKAMHGHALHEQPTTLEPPAQHSDLAPGLAEIRALLMQQAEGMTDGDRESEIRLMDRLSQVESNLSAIVCAEVDRVLKLLPSGGPSPTEPPIQTGMTEEEAERRIRSFGSRTLPLDEASLRTDEPEPSIEELQARLRVLREARSGPAGLRKDPRVVSSDVDNAGG